ncbi:MAG: hypothetical protein GX556_09010 [Fibrobacter sp.]|mgnify:CR=1 FL=1|nr:hypothetical protein [Fibrobacter sp.]
MKLNNNTAAKDSLGLTFIIAVLVIGYLIGTMTHIFLLFDVVRLGFINSAKAFGVSPVVNGYWISLTVIDPVIALLLLRNRKIGVLLGFINILINVIVNSSLQIASLSLITPHSVYDSLGNIYNGLQIALLLFSFFTLPLFFLKPDFLKRKRFDYFNFFKFIPVIALTIGLFIHLAGLLNLMRNFQSLWNLWVHVSMTVFNAGLIYALLKRMKSGYIIGIIGFSIFGLLQSGFACAIFLGFNCSFNLVMAITISICCLSISSLLTNREIYKFTFRQITGQD